MIFYDTISATEYIRQHGIMILKSKLMHYRHDRTPNGHRIKGGPEWRRYGGMIMYRQDDLDKWIVRQKVRKVKDI